MFLIVDRSNGKYLYISVLGKDSFARSQIYTKLKLTSVGFEHV